MSEAKFTSGSWWVNNTGKHWNNPNIDSIEICYSDDQECICDTVYDVNDAYLIAAAPEMYFELRRDLTRLENSKGNFKAVPPEITREIKRKKKLLAKARGEQ